MFSLAERDLRTNRAAIHASLKKKFLIYGLCLVAVCGLVWVVYPKRVKTESKSSGGGRPREGTAVRTMVVRPEPLEENVIATGSIRAEESVELQPEIAGKLMQLHFQEGTAVKAGDLLAVINDAELRASLQRAIYRRDLAELKARRITTLIDKGGVPQQEYDIAASELNVLDAEVELIRAQLARTEIRAPFDGIIGLRRVSEGAQVSTATRLATLQDIRRMKVDFSLPEKHAGALAPGSRVAFSVTGSDRSYEAEVYAVEPGLDETTRTRLIRAHAANPDGTLMPGAFARVTVPVEKIASAVLIPSTALTADSGEKSVFVVEKGKARRQVVQTGLRRADSILITAGLRPGDEVIIAGTQMVRPGAAVEAVR